MTIRTFMSSGAAWLLARARTGACPLPAASSRSTAAGIATLSLLALAMAGVSAEAQGPAAAPAPALPPQVNMPANVPINSSLISLAVATQLVQDSLVACEARGEHASALVMDGDGFTRVLMSDDNGASVGLVSSARKAKTVLDLKMSTHDAMDRLQSDKAFADQYGKDDRYFFHPGALPLYRDGKLVAILSVGGGHQQDEDCAKAALAKVGGFTTAP